MKGRSWSIWCGLLHTSTYAFPCVFLIFTIILQHLKLSDISSRQASKQPSIHRIVLLWAQNRSPMRIPVPSIWPKSGSSCVGLAWCHQKLRWPFGLYQLTNINVFSQSNNNFVVLNYILFLYIINFFMWIVFFILLYIQIKKITHSDVKKQTVLIIQFSNLEITS